MLDDLALEINPPAEIFQRMTIHKLIRELRTKKGWSMEKLAEEVSKAEGLAKPLNWQTVQQWEKEDGTAPKRNRLAVVAALLDTSVAELMSGSAATVAHEVRELSAEYAVGAPSVNVPLLANAASMGGGDDVLCEDVITGQLSLTVDFVSEQLRPARPEALRFVHAYGDSMSPTLNSGDVLLVNTAVQEAAVDGIYVLEAAGRLFVKRVSRRLDGKFEISSDNPAKKTVDVLNGDHQVSIKGRVVWVWNGRKI